MYKEKSVYLLFTGVREAPDWDANEDVDIKGYLDGMGCSRGIIRVERLGRRQQNHRGMGRFVLAQYLESDAQRVRKNWERMALL